MKNLKAKYIKTLKNFLRLILIFSKFLMVGVLISLLLKLILLIFGFYAYLISYIVFAFFSFPVMLLTVKALDSIPFIIVYSLNTVYSSMFYVISKVNNLFNSFTRFTVVYSEYNTNAVYLLA